MKIAVLIPGIVPVPAVLGGAVEQLTEYIIDGNESAGDYKIDLYTIDNELLDKYNYKNTDVIRIKLKKLDILVDKIFNKFYSVFNIEKQHNTYGKKAVKLLKKCYYDYILVENNMYIYEGVYKVKEKYKKNAKLIFHLHNNIGKRDKPKRLCELIAKTSSTILTCSNFLENRFNSMANTTKAKTLYNVIDFNKFYFDQRERELIRNKYNLNDSFVFGYVGRIDSEKGVYELLKAFKTINDKNARLMIIGDSLVKNYLDKYTKLVLNEIEDIKGRVIFVGSVPNDEVYKFMSAVDCIVIPTMCEEAFGIVALEALACKRVIISTISGGLVEILNENNSILVEKENIIENLSKAMDVASCKDYNNCNYNIDKERCKFNIKDYYNNFKNMIKEDEDGKNINY